MLQINTYIEAMECTGEGWPSSSCSTMVCMPCSMPGVPRVTNAKSATRPAPTQQPSLYGAVQLHSLDVTTPLLHTEAQRHSNREASSRAHSNVFSQM